MARTIEAGKDGAKKPAAAVSPEEMLKQAVTGTKTGPAPAGGTAALPARRSFRLDGSGRLAAASAVALACGVVLGLAAAPRERGGEALAQITADLAAGRSDTARLAQEIERLARTTTGLREASETARTEIKALGNSVTDRIGRTEQALDRRLTSLSEAAARNEREQGERLAGLIAQSEKRPPAPTVTAAAKPEPKPEARSSEPTQTGSLPDKPKTETVEGWALRDVYDGVAILEDRRRRLVEVGRGDAVPGVGRVDAIERRGRQWVVVTRQGVITPQAW